MEQPLRKTTTTIATTADTSLLQLSALKSRIKQTYGKRKPQTDTEIENDNTNTLTTSPSTSTSYANGKDNISDDTGCLVRTQSQRALNDDESENIGPNSVNDPLAKRVKSQSSSLKHQHYEVPSPRSKVSDLNALSTNPSMHGKEAPRQKGQTSLKSFFAPKPSVSIKKSLFGLSKAKSREGSGSSAPTTPSSSTSESIIASKLPLKYQQLYLDLGQKQGPILCPVCGMSYHRGQTEDEAVHDSWHRKIVAGVEWPGYKTEIVAEVFAGGSKIVAVTRESSAFEKRKMLEVIQILTTDLGAVPLTHVQLQSCKVFLYIDAKKKILGCVVVEPISQAYQRRLGTDGRRVLINEEPVLHCSETPTPAIIGISRIWTLPTARRNGIATKLLDAVASQFVFGCPVEKKALAFSQPTAAGTALAARYTGIKEFLVYLEASD